MKKYLIYISACLVVGCMVSCQLDELIGENEGNGYIQLSSVDVDKKVQLRSADETLAVDILNTDGTVFRHADDWTTLQGQSFLVPAGSGYTVKAYSYGKTIEEGFEVAPVYTGEEEVTVMAGVNQTVDVTCTLAQSMVTVNYSEKFKSKFSDYSALLTGHSALSLEFTADETRPAYVKAGQPLTIAVTLSPQGGSSRTITNTVTDNAKAAYHYKVNFDVNTDGSGSINVSVDQTIHEYEITLGVPLEPDGVSTTSIAGDASKVWGGFAILCGQCTFADPTTPIQFQYRKADGQDWKTIEAQQVDGTTEYTAKATGLELGTEYQYKIVCGANEGEVLTFTTEAYEEIPNLNFDTWTQEKKNWYANPVANNLDDPQAYWATGNEGVTSFLAGSHDPITVPVEGADARNGKAAKMHTITGITLVGSASGNLFIGRYKTDMGNPSASVTFGRPYSGARPTRLTGYYKYSPAPMSTGSYPGGLTTDECNIYMTIWDAGGNQIGFGEFVGKENVEEYTQFSFDINYSDPTKQAAKITIVATSSHYGGHFEGNNITGQVGEGSTLWVDDFELSYD